MAEKKAFIFDTNFIIQNNKLDCVIENLKDDYTVYVSQVSIDERIAQQCRELKAQYDTIEADQEKFKKIATIKVIISYKQNSSSLSTLIQKGYSRTFGKNIIPFSKDGTTFSTIIDRANQKLPPFSSDRNASDKGFKDCLLWLSILSFFKDNGENEVVFSTDDHGFLDNKEFLSSEFNRETGKHIEIKPNSYYREIAKPPEEEKPQIPAIPPSPSIDLKSLREEIRSSIDPLCFVVEENYYGEENWVKTFTAFTKFEKDMMSAVFDNMGKVLQEHLLEASISATKALSVNKGISDGEAEIPTNNIENAVILYQRIKRDYPQYLEQFWEASAKILNNNYVAPKTLSEEELPF